MRDDRIAVTIADATKIAGLGRSTLYKLIDGGKIIPRKAGRRTLILVDDLDRYLKSLPTPEGSASTGNSD